MPYVFQILTQSKSSDSLFYFSLKLKTTTRCFEQDIFYNNLAENAMNKTIPRNIAGCYQNRNSSQTFLLV